MNVRSRFAGWVVALASLATTVGCSSTTNWVKNIDAPGGVYDKISVTYRTPSTQVNATAAAARAVEGQLVSYQTPAPSVVPDGREAILEITYPHPEGKEDYALVQVLVPRVREEPKPPTGLERVMGVRRDDDPVLRGKSTTYNIDITRAELLELMAAMREAGYFTSKKADAPTTHLTARLDGMRVHKNWGQVPQLDSLLARTYQQAREGQLAATAGAATASDVATVSATTASATTASASTPPANAGQAADARSSVNAYRTIVAGDNARGTPAVTATSAEVARDPRVTRLPAIEGTAVR